MTKWTNSKNVPSFPGLLDVEMVDDSVTAIVVQGTDGPVRISKRDYGGLTFFTPTPAPAAKRWRVSGTVDDLAIVPKYFEDQYDADRQVRGHDTLKVTEVTVILDDTGAFAGEAACQE